MVESNFKYTYSLLDKINKNATKNVNLFCEIAMFIILLGSIVLFVLGHTVLGVVFAVVFAVLLVSLIFANKSIKQSNAILRGQNVKVVFNETNLIMTTLSGNKILSRATMEYNAVKKVEEKQDLLYVFFGKNMAVIMPKNSFKNVQEYNKAKQLASNNYVV